MDRRSWPWKKKSSDATEKKVTAVDSVVNSLDSPGSPAYQNNLRKQSYIQISMESYTRFTEMEAQVKTLNNEVCTLNEKLASAHSEITTKDNLVKQQAKVAEDAIAGWEKAEAEASALKHQLESVTQLKLDADDRASQLDGALKECMRQIRSMKEEHQEKLHEIKVIQTKQLDKNKVEFETKMANLDQELQKLSAENAALSRVLQDGSDTIMKISKEKSECEAEIELLKADIQSHEREASSLKYELHVVSKELEIRNEEKNMSLRSAEVATKHQLEGVKKIAKLEAESQRLRGLVRKKLPGAAALAQMRLEVENLGYDYQETQVRRSSSRNSRTPEFSLNNMQQQCQKQVQFLMERLLATEEETTMLKEALAKRNNELEESRTMFAEVATKLQSFEAESKVQNRNKTSRKSNIELQTEYYSSSQITSYPPSSASISEELDIQANKDGSRNPLELMDDFLEMERLAHLSAESNSAASISSSSPEKKTLNEDDNTLNHIEKDRTIQTHISSNAGGSTGNVHPDTDQFSLSRFKSKLAMMLESESKDKQGLLSQQSINCSPEKKELPDESEKQQLGPQDTKGVFKNASLIQNGEPEVNILHVMDKKLAAAIFQIRNFVTSLGKEAMAMKADSCGASELNGRIDKFHVSLDKMLHREISLADLLLDLACVLAKASEARINAVCYDHMDVEINNINHTERSTLQENKADQNGSLGEKHPNGFGLIFNSASDFKALGEVVVSPASWKSLLEELEKIRSEKDNMEMNLARCTENLEQTQFQLQETEKHLAETKSQLESCKQSNTLMETQLKCVSESYRSLEVHAEGLDDELNILRGKAHTLEDELGEEKQKHQIALDKCKDLEEQIQRNESCTKCSSVSVAYDEIKLTQEKEIADATEKLVQCQEVIFLLDRQLKSLQPHPELIGRPSTERHPRNSNALSMDGSQDSSSQMEMEKYSPSTNISRQDGESLSDAFNSASSTPSKTDMSSPSSSNSPKRKLKSSSSSLSSLLTPEKPSSGLSRFFSPKRE
ncbi:hypothetical protein Sjap_017044 [Stephania japonica]|uniref:Filament-like plant protein 4 n=1 Tax=Stephania japonica TaxID=461633 RepID=A0AAP0NJE7_9MAGN